MSSRSKYTSQATHLPSLSLLSSLSSTPCQDLLLIHESLTPTGVGHQVWILPGPWCIRLHLWSHSSWSFSRSKELRPPKRQLPMAIKKRMRFKTTPQKNYVFNPKLFDSKSLLGVTQVISYHCLKGTSHLSGIKWAYFRSLKASGISWGHIPFSSAPSSTPMLHVSKYLF